jgi:hypothetical protein
MASSTLKQKDAMAFSKLIFHLLLLLMARGQTKDVQCITGIYSPHPAEYVTDSIHSSAGRGAFCGVLSGGFAAAQHPTFLFLPRSMKPDEQSHPCRGGMLGGGSQPSSAFCNNFGLDDLHCFGKT